MTEPKLIYTVNTDANKSAAELREEYSMLVSAIATAEIRIAHIELELKLRAFTE